MYKVSFSVKDLDGFKFSINDDGGESVTAADIAHMAADVFNESGMVKISRDEYESLIANQWPNTEAPSDAPEYLRMLPSDRQHLIMESLEKPAQALTQIDWFAENINNDGDTAALFFGVTVELRKTVCMRVHIPPHYTREQIVAGLTGMIEWVKNSGDYMQDETRKFAKGYQEKYIDAINPYAEYANDASADNVTGLPF